MSDSTAADAGEEAERPPSDQPVTGAGGETAADALVTASEPQFRTVSTSDGRAGIRLEGVFWDSLSQISASLGIKRRELVATVVHRARAAHLNVASALRSYVAMVQAGENARMKSLLAIPSLVRLQQLAPVPSFALTREKRLVSANSEFVQLLRGMARDPSRTIVPDIAQLSLDIPVEDLFDQLRQEGASIRCTLTIRVDDRNRRGVCKVVAVPPMPAQAIVAYLVGRIDP